MLDSGVENGWQIAKCPGTSKCGSFIVVVLYPHLDQLGKPQIVVEHITIILSKRSECVW